MYTDALFQIARHLKQGRLKYDSVTLRKDSILPNDFFIGVYKDIKQTKDVFTTFKALEPKHAGYDSLKKGLRFFLDSVSAFKRFTYLPFPMKDSRAFHKLLQKRFFEEDVVLSATDEMDTTAWRAAISSYQKSKGLKVTGKVNENTVTSLNNTD